MHPVRLRIALVLGVLLALAGIVLIVRGLTTNVNEANYSGVLNVILLVVGLAIASYSGYRLRHG
ncbi:hypothetical protein BH11ACT2_BH11ACT2_06590 [soil metagenome]